MYKTHLTATVFKEFSSHYHHASPSAHPSQPYVFVDESGVKLLTNVISGYKEEEGIFALAMAQDGFVEMLSMEEVG